MKMRPSSTFIGLLALAVAGHCAAQVILYDQEGLRGRTFVANRSIDNLDRSGFNDRAASVIIQRGRWEVCEDAYFRGRCVTLSQGQYPSLGGIGMGGRISSLRPLHGKPQYAYPPPPGPPPYPYYPHYGERLYQANVVAVRAVVGPPTQRCWIERQQVTADSGPNVPGAIIGGIVGGVLGHQIGGGRGNDVATAVGAIGGAAVGANVNRSRGPTYTQDVRRCANVPPSTRPDYWDVTYLFRGQYHRAQLAEPPGATITVNDRGEPRL